MAHIETWYRCPTCNKVFDELKHAISCKNQHQIRAEKWAVGKGGKAVKIQENHKNGVKYALAEADLSDNIQERARQIKEVIDYEKR